MGKGILTVVVSVPISIASFFIGLLVRDWKTGLICALAVISLSLIIALLFLIFQKKMSLLDVFIPIPLAVVWSIILIPFSLGTSIFSAPACIGSAIILSLILYFYHTGQITKPIIIIPAIVFIYEMLPVNIPGPIDDYFAFGGDATLAIFTAIKVWVGKDGANINIGSSKNRAISND